MATQDILNERQGTHGDFSTNAALSQAFKDIIHRNNAKLSTSQRESLDMIVHKISRILAGDPNHKDHWDDIAGYAQLVSDRIHEQV